MTLYEKIMKIYPSLTMDDFISGTPSILLQDDNDGKGAYIKSWTNSNPQPTQEKLDAITG